MAGARTYGDRCGVARGLDLVGERWALLVVRELLLGPKRFTDLRTGIPHASPNVLAQRLRELERTGVLRRRKLPPPAGSRVYELTDWGAELEPVVLALGRWGSGAPFPPGDAKLGVDSAIIALRTVFDPSAARDLSASYELRLGEDSFRAEVADGQLELARGSAEEPDATIETDPATLSAVLWHGRQLGEAERSGDVKIEGSRAAVRRFLGLFTLLDPVHEGPAISDRLGETARRRSTVSILVRFTPASLTAEQYDETIRKLEEAGDFPPDGLDYHVCFGSDGNLNVSEIWDSQEQFEAFGERLMPVLADAGIEAGEPTLLEIHNTIRR